MAYYNCKIYQDYTTVDSVQKGFSRFRFFKECKTTAFVVAFISGEGITFGAHRLWCHRSLKAHRPLRLILIACQTAAGQNCCHKWVREHRQHHKYSDTAADPHDATRGLFFSHCGWLMMKRHPEYKEKIKSIFMEDIEKDPVVMFQKKSIYPAENSLVSPFALGEGWHNYHHAFPWDYKASEFGKHLNFTRDLIEFFARMGWAYDLKEASEELVDKNGTPRHSKPYTVEILDRKISKTIEKTI